MRHTANLLALLPNLLPSVIAHAWKAAFVTMVICCLVMHVSGEKSVVACMRGDATKYEFVYTLQLRATWPTDGEIVTLFV